MKVAIIGRSEILYETIKTFLRDGFEIKLIITSKETPEYKKKSKDFKKLAKKIKAKYIYSNKLEKYIDEIKKTKCEIAVSSNHVNIISQEIIDLFPLGILNAHGGDLPRYRGNACQAWAILNSESHVGLCIHKMLGGELDLGNIISKEYFNININTKITECNDWMTKRIPIMFLNSVKKLKRNNKFFLEKNPKNSKEKFRCYPRIPEDGKIDWSKSNKDILRLINASNKPYAGAYCFFNNKKLIIWDATLYNDNEKYLAVCGQVSAIEKNSIIIITGNGKLRIKKIEYEKFIGQPTNKIRSIRSRLK
ncbi:formyltransferase family protein [Candidatus Pelagibacter bacterium]|nr:formyltransferase family protein [Candidatus Pelagibacter bacterium]MDA8828897.1 formyltransferase family protein [Candidatus Pelagibacter bacterium]